MTASRPRIAATCQCGNNPTVVSSSGIGPVPSDSKATVVVASSAAYKAMSTGVRLSPLVSGTRSGHGGSRIVLGRSQYRIEPSGGKYRLLSGPKPQPSPTTSNSSVYSTIFWKTIGSAHQAPTFVNPSMPAVVSATSRPPSRYRQILPT